MKIPSFPFPLVLKHMLKFKFQLIFIFYIFIFSLFNSYFGYGIEYKIDDTTIVISPPQGFSDVSLVSQDVLAFFQSIYQGDSKLISAYINQKDAKDLLEGKDPELENYIVVLSLESLKDFNMTKNKFSELRSSYHENYDTIYQELMKRSDKFKNNGSRILSEHFDVDIMIEIGGVVPLGIDYETVSSIIMSQLMQGDRYIDGGELEHIIAATTTAVLLVKGRVINLQIYSLYKNESDLKWTRSTAITWANQILDSNSLEGDFPGSDIVEPKTHLTEMSRMLLLEDQIEYNLKNHSKANGLDISIKYPSSWKAKESSRPHIVQTFSGQYDGTIAPMCSIAVFEMPEFVSSILNTEESLESIATQLIPENSVFIDGGETDFGIVPSVWIKSYMEGQRAGANFGMFSLGYYLFYNNKMFTLQCAVTGVPEERILVEDLFKSYLPVFQSIGNSIVINDVWNNTEEENTMSGFSNSIIEDSYINILISLILPWVIGLTPPFLIRYKILKHPMKQSKAIQTIIIQWILNFIFFMGLGASSSISGFLLLVAWPSYAILRKGYRQYDEKQNDGKTDQEKINKERENHSQEKKKWDEERERWEKESKNANEEAKKAREEAREYKEKTRKYAEQESEKKSSSNIIKDEAYYADVLGLTENYTWNEVNSCYRELALKYHPDRVNHLGVKLKEIAEKEMKEINEAIEFYKKKFNM